MKTSSVEFISQSPTPSPMNSNYRRFVLLRKFLSLGSGNEGKRGIVLNRRPELYRGKYRCSLSVPFLYVSDSPLVSMEIPLRTAYGQNGRCDMQPKPSSLRAQAHQSKSRTETEKGERLLRKNLELEQRKENARGARAGVTF
ncbi:hypothetical protein TNCV_3277211 [Trichonephila clavipes]|nr:hypothetical protein TNCV_3277211 [Trichonephila clavipes]